jgi:hypothetical protein
MNVRLIIQRVVTTILAIRAGLRDARQDRPSFFWAVLWNPGTLVRGNRIAKAVLDARSAIQQGPRRNKLIKVLNPFAQYLQSTAG